MKKLVGIIIGIFVIFMSVVFVGGFIQKTNSESKATNNSTSTKSASTNTPTQAYTIDDVAKHSSVGNCWLIINNNVYDVSSYLGQHPGGASTIIPYCGKEATHAFDTQDRGSRGGHSRSASNMLADYQIGSIK